MTPQTRPLIWRLLYHPMFVISAAVHTTVLVMPLPEEPVVLEESETPEDIIGLASLSATPPAEPEPEPEPTPEPEPEPQPTPEPQPAPEPAPQSSAPESTTPSETASAAPDSTEATESSEPTELPEPTDSTPPFDPTVPRQQFVSNLANLDGDVTAMGIMPRRQDVAEPDAFFDANGDRREGINEFRWLNDRRINDVYQVLESRYQQAGIIFEPVEPGYGGGDLYALKTEDGEPFFYLNLAPASSGGVSTILVVWSFNPLDPSGALPAQSSTDP